MFIAAVSFQRSARSLQQSLRLTNSSRTRFSEACEAAT